MILTKHRFVPLEQIAPEVNAAGWDVASWCKPRHCAECGVVLDACEERVCIPCDRWLCRDGEHIFDWDAE